MILPSLPDASYGTANHCIVLQKLLSNLAFGSKCNFKGGGGGGICLPCLMLSLTKAWFPYNRSGRPGRPGLFKLCPSDRDDYMETPQRRPRTIDKDRKDRDDRDRLDRNISIRKTETAIARDR